MAANNGTKESAHICRVDITILVTEKILLLHSRVGSATDLLSDEVPQKILVHHELFSKSKMVMVAAFQRQASLIARSHRTVSKRLLTSSPPGSSPHDSPSKIVPKSLGIGTVAGVLGSLAGMGGGFVMIPLMTSRSLLALSQHQAHGTSLFAVAATGFAGCWSYATFVQWDLAAAIALTGMVSARYGAKYASSLSGSSLKYALGVLMLIMAPGVHAKKYVLDQSSTKQPEAIKDNGNDTTQTGLRLVSASAIGLGSGFMAGLFGVGGGVIVVPALTVFTSCDHYQALATSLTAMVLPAATGTLTHFQAGNVALRVAPPLAIGACIGAYTGGKFAQVYAEESSLQWGFSGLLVFLGIRTLTKAG